MSRPLARRLSRLERPETRDPVMEAWLDVLEADDPNVALRQLCSRFPNPSEAYRSALASLK